MSDGIPHAHSTSSIARRSSMRASEIVLPISWTRTRESSSRFSSMSCLRMKNGRARLTGGSFRQLSNASWAIRTASSTSSRVDIGTRATTSPVAGSTTSRMSVERDSTHFPPT